MNLNTIHKQSFLQVAKMFISFRGRNRNTEKKTSEERPKKHKALRKTVSLGSSGMEMSKEPDVRFDTSNDANNGKHKVLKEIQETNESQKPFKTKYYSQKAKGGRDQNAATSQNSFKPRYYSQKVRGGRDQNEHPLLPKHRVNLKQLPDKPRRRKFSLKGVRQGDSKLRRRTYNLSCPDLGRSYDILDSDDSLDRNTVHMFRDKQYSDTELIEIYFE